MTCTFHVESGAARLAGEQCGAGRAVVLLHAGVADRRMWRAQLADLGEEFHTIAYDRRGFGETTSPDEVFAHVDDLCAVLDDLGVGATALVGCSQGGRIAIDFALRHPERVTELALIAPAVSGLPWPESLPADIAARLEVLEEAEKADDLERVNQLEAELWLDGPTSPSGRVGGRARELFLAMNAVALGMPGLTGELEPPSAAERLGELGQPALVLWGDLDFPHVAARCRELACALPAVRGEELRGVAHLPSLERPAVTTRLLREFLEAHPSDEPGETASRA